jgi:ABC-2 type transport system ATP-binding protein
MVIPSEEAPSVIQSPGREIVHGLTRPAVAPHPDATAGTAVAFDRVTRRFDETVALDAVSLAIPVGQTVALLGPNGAGKSTAINLMLGLLEPTSGHVRTLGREPRVAVRSGRVGSMLQTAGLPAGALVGELVEFVRSLYPHPLARSAILDRAGLAALAGRRVDRLSGGETQRVRFALAIAGDPELVFLDEPTVAMDVESRRAFWDDMRRSAADGRTVLFATHYLEEADQVADRIVVLDRGQIVADGTGASIKAGVADRTVRFSLTSDEPAALSRLPGVASLDVRGAAVTIVSRDADATVRALIEDRIAFRDLEVVAADLESAFLKLTADRPAS